MKGELPELNIVRIPRFKVPAPPTDPFLDPNAYSFFSGTWDNLADAKGLVGDSFLAAAAL